MTQARWDASDFDDDEQTRPERPIPTIVSLHFLRSALRRRWLVCALTAVLGLLAAVAFLVASPGSHIAKSTLVLAHDPQTDPSRAMATDVSLLRTRTVAAKTMASLGLTMTPDEFLKTVTTEPVSSELLSLTLSAPTDAEAERRLTALTSTYLEFRAEQLSMQSNVLVDGMQQRIKKLRNDVANLSRLIDAGNTSASRLSDMIAERANLQTQLETLQQSVEDATLRHTSVVSSSRVIDPAATDASGMLRRIVLTLASGLIGGIALGCGIVLFFAIISDRLWRRSDVAAALEVPVPVSVGKIAPIPKRWLWLPHLRTVDGRRTHERQRLARVIELELPVPGRGGRLAVACIDNAAEVRSAVAAAAADLAADGRSIALIDLTEHGSIDSEVARLNAGSTTTPIVLRPRGIPALAVGAADLCAVGHEDGGPRQLERNDVTLVLADLDPSVGAHHLKAWTDRVIVPVTAGRSSAERVTTAAELIRTAGLEMRVAVLLRAERTDNSSGVSGFDQPAAVDLGAGHEQRLLGLEQPIDAGQGLASETMAVTTATQVSDEDRTTATAALGSDGEHPQLAEEEPDAGTRLTIDEESDHDVLYRAAAPQTPTGRQPADDELATTEDQATTDEQQAEAVLHADAEVTATEKPPEAEVAEEQQTDDEQPDAVVAEAEELVEAEMANEIGQKPEADAAVEPQAGEEQIEEQQADVEVVEPEAQPEAEVAEAEQGPEAEMTAEGEQRPEADVAEAEQAGADEQQADDQQSVGDQQTAEEEPEAEHPGEADTSAEPNQVPDGPKEEERPQSWNLYLVKYPPVYVGSGGNRLDSDHDSAVNGAHGEAENGQEPRLVPEVTAEVDKRAAGDEPAGDGHVSNGPGATTRRRPRRRTRKAQDPNSSRV